MSKQAFFQAYQTLLDDQVIKYDAQQHQVAQTLDTIHSQLSTWLTAPGWRKLLLRKPKGIYLYGSVGTGKTLLSEQFIKTLPPVPIYQAHFHQFMSELHSNLAKSLTTNSDDQLAAYAKRLASLYQVIWLDELYITDIADFMMLTRLFALLINHKVILLFTSNRPHTKLYQDKVWLEHFLTFTTLIETHFTIINLDGTDHRREKLLAHNKVYFTPNNEDSKNQLDKFFSKLCEFEPANEVSFEVGGRTLKFSKGFSKYLYSTFEELCCRPLGAADYIAIAEKYDIVLISGIPRMTKNNRNEAKRFMQLIDALYQHKVMVIISADAYPEELYIEGDGSFEFARTISRLEEMRSAEYWKH